MSTALLGLALLAASGPEAVTGTVRVSRGGVGESSHVALVSSDGTATTVAGDLAVEVANLQSARVEATGVRDGNKLVVKAYTILDLGGGARPQVVGVLVANDNAYAIADGDGTPIPLSLTPRMRQSLARHVGGKLWVIGKKLVSGELKLTRYGVLRENQTDKADKAAGADKE